LLDERFNQPLIEIGRRDDYEHQLISSRGGSLSSRLGDRIALKRRALLGPDCDDSWVTHDQTRKSTTLCHVHD
jgi:hypothetical protein